MRNVPLAPAATSEAVTAVMRANRKYDTRPELIVRKLLYAMGYRYRLHARELPGRPDIVFRNRRKVLFVHGCFWHQHQSQRCFLRSYPKSNLDYWRPKLRRNVERDRKTAREIMGLNWRALTLWECQLGDAKHLAKRLRKFLGPP